MSDLISRQAAIDALHMHLMYRMGTDSNKKRLDDWINSLPSAQPEVETQMSLADCISRQDALDAIDRITRTDNWQAAVSMALLDLPSAQPEQSIAQERYEDLCEYFKDCSDQGRSILTDRKEFKSWLDRMKWHVIECDKLGRELEKLKSAQPTIEPERTGHWVEFPNHNAYVCSECGRMIETTDGKNNVYKHYPYCHCGARMEGEEHD